jgi:hypothetical protein
MGTGRRPQNDLDTELAQLQREVDAATGSAPAPKPARAERSERPEKSGGRFDTAKASGRSLLRKVAAVAIILIAVAIALKIAFGFLITFLWLAVGLVAVGAIIWAIRQF